MAQKLEVVIVGDSSKLDSALNSTKGGLGKFGKIAGAAAVGGVAALGVGLFKSVQAFAESEKVAAQTAAVIKSTGGAANITAKQVDGLATAIAMKSGVDDEAIASGENMLLTFTNIQNRVGAGKDIFNQATQTLTDMSVAMGTDMSKQAIQLGKALNDPIKGVSALAKVGVTFDDAQKKSIATMMQHGNVAGAQAIILKELQKEFGGSAAAAGQTFSGQLDILKVKLGNVAETIGATVVPMLLNIVTWVNVHWPEIEAVISATIGRVVAFVQENMPRIRATITNVLNTIVTFWRTWGDEITAVVTVVFNTLKPLIKGALDIIASVIRAVGAAMRGDWSGVWSNIKQVPVTAMNAIKDALEVALPAIGTAALNVGKKVLEKIKSGIGDIGGWISNKVTGAINSVIDAVERVINGAIGRVNRAMTFSVDIPGNIPGLPDKISVSGPNIPSISLPRVGGGGGGRLGGGSNVNTSSRVSNVNVTQNFNNPTGVNADALMQAASFRLRNTAA